MNVRMAYHPVWKIPNVSTLLDLTCATAIQDILEMDLSSVQVQCLLPHNCTWCDLTCALLDLNECELSLDDCDRNALCEDIVGSYNCTCNFGYSGNGTLCSKLDYIIIC